MACHDDDVEEGKVTTRIINEGEEGRGNKINLTEKGVLDFGWVWFTYR